MNANVNATRKSLPLMSKAENEMEKLKTMDKKKRFKLFLTNVWWAWWKEEGAVPKTKRKGQTTTVPALRPERKMRMNMIEKQKKEKGYGQFHEKGARD